MKTKFIPILLLLFATFASAAEVIPPKPTDYAIDQAGVLSASVLAQLNQQLSDFDNQTSNQIHVAIYPKMQSDSSIDDYTLRIANQWKAGQKKSDNGAILFVFVQDRKMFIQVGSGLEGVLPDALCKRIVDEEIAPRFKQGNYDGGIMAGVQAMMAATRGEYKGTGSHHNDSVSGIWLAIIIIFVILSIISKMRRYSTYGPSGLGTGWFLGSMIGGFGGGGYSGGGGGFSSGGGGGFSGGSFGGGGAGGSW